MNGFSRCMYNFVERRDSPTATGVKTKKKLRSATIPVPDYTY